MNRFLTIVLLLGAGIAAAAQSSAPVNTVDPFRDTSMLKPPAGAKVAVWEFEDLECPACAFAYPIVRAAVEHYAVPLVRHDFPLAQHIWSFDAAVTARYLQDKVSPKVADDFRGDVFAHQTNIASKDDLASYAQAWFKSHGQTLPAVVDPSGLFKQEVSSDRTLGERIGVIRTPTIIVVTQQHWVQVTNVSLLGQTIEEALAETGAPVVSSSSRIGGR